MAKILFVEDDESLAESVVDWLLSQQYVVEVVDNGSEGWDRLRLYKYDLAILDWQLPGMSGLEILKEYRNIGGMIPILMLTGKTETREKETGLDSGADDYLTKPFDFKELSARLRALLRRPPVARSTILKARDIELDPVACTVTKSGAVVELPAREFALLEFFMRHPNQLFSPDALLDRVWSSDSEATIDALKSCLKRLRKRLHIDGEEILKNVHGIGYKLET